MSTARNSVKLAIGSSFIMLSAFTALALSRLNGDEKLWIALLSAGLGVAGTECLLRQNMPKMAMSFLMVAGLTVASYIHTPTIRKAFNSSRQAEPQIILVAPNNFYQAEDQPSIIYDGDFAVTL